MNCQRDHGSGSRSPVVRTAHQRVAHRLGAVMIGLALATTALRAQSTPIALTSATPLVFDGVTVIDVEHGTRIPDQRIVIAGNRIKAMGGVGTVGVPAGAQVLDARGKYLIPGLWDMHTHPWRSTDIFYPLFVANGVTGIRDAGSRVPLDTLVLWRREILAGSRVGPPRQLLSGVAISDSLGKAEMIKAVRRSGIAYMAQQMGVRKDQITTDADTTPPCAMTEYPVCVGSVRDARRLVDSLRVAGADFIKTYQLTGETYFAIAAEARRLKVPFGGHLAFVSAADASDSGASIIDHLNTAGGLDTLCQGSVGTVVRCQPIAERFRRNGTWWVPTVATFHSPGTQLDPMANPGGTLQLGLAAKAILARSHEFEQEFRTGGTLRLGWLRDSAAVHSSTSSASSRAADLHGFALLHKVGLPILAGTDVSGRGGDNLLPGFSLHTELALYVAEGMTPLEVLQTATLNPAKLLHATDSLGTVATGKLADLVLLDADPLQDIANTTAIRGVVANGRYYDRAALDRLIAEARAKMQARSR